MVNHDSRVAVVVARAKKDGDPLVCMSNFVWVLLWKQLFVKNGGL